MKPFALFLVVILLATACATSPTGRKQLMIVSEEHAIEASKQAYTEALKPFASEGKLDNDPILKARVNTITSRLIAQAVIMRPETRNWEWSIKILDDPKTVNAWCMAGGKMALYTGLIKQVNPTDDELAQVMGHEIAHALANHTAEKMSVAIASSVGVAAVGAATDRPAVTMASVAVAALAVKLPNSRVAETEADRIGIELAAKAGYDPRAAVSLWEKMARVSRGSSQMEFLSTHPNPGNRQSRLRQLVPQMMPYYERGGNRPVYPL